MARFNETETLSTCPLLWKVDNDGGIWCCGPFFVRGPATLSRLQLGPIVADTTGRSYCRSLSLECVGSEDLGYASGQTSFCFNNFQGLDRICSSSFITSQSRTYHQPSSPPTDGQAWATSLGKITQSSAGEVSNAQEIKSVYNRFIAYTRHAGSSDRFTLILAAISLGGCRDAGNSRVTGEPDISVIGESGFSVISDML